jgi:hypothetical protein
MAALNYISIPSTGVAFESSLVAADVSLTDTFPADTGKVFAVANADASPHTVTIVAPVSSTVCGSFGSLDIEDKVITIPAGETQLFTLPLGYSETGLFTFAYDDVTDVTVGGFALSPNV